MLTQEILDEYLSKADKIKYVNAPVFLVGDDFPTRDLADNEVFEPVAHTPITYYYNKFEDFIAETKDKYVALYFVANDIQKDKPTRIIVRFVELTESEWNNIHPMFLGEKPIYKKDWRSHIIEDLRSPNPTHQNNG